MDINPSDYIVIRDTREQLPYDLSPFQMLRQKLDTGDYSVVGFEDQICIERKSRDDFIGSITQGRDRFNEEMERMLSIPMRMILVECSMMDIVKQRYISRTHPNSVIGTIAKYMSMGIPVMLACNRTAAQDFARRFLYQSIKKIKKNLPPVAEVDTTLPSNSKE